jgi:transposase InsO family protein
MSYNDSAFYVAETNRKNRLKAPLKPFVGILSGRNAPLIKSNDSAIGWFSLAGVLDVFSPMVGGWSIAAIQDATLLGQARPLAPTRRRPEAGLLHHSDRGRTSTSQSSQALLQQEGLRARSNPETFYLPVCESPSVRTSNVLTPLFPRLAQRG